MIHSPAPLQLPLSRPSSSCTGTFGDGHMSTPSQPCVLRGVAPDKYNNPFQCIAHYAAPLRESTEEHRKEVYPRMEIGCTVMRQCGCCAEGNGWAPGNTRRRWRAQAMNARTNNPQSCAQCLSRSTLLKHSLTLSSSLRHLRTRAPYASIQRRGTVATLL